MIQNETICAAATPAGGAITVIRVSGNNAIKIADKIFRGKAKLSETRPNSIRYGEIVDADGTIVDDVLISVFKSPNSYTGENSIEISCHGAMYITKSIIKLLVDNGCKLAQPGEFTQRAFLNGKMDLSQAEAVADLIAASTKASHDIAISQLKGNFSNELATLREQLLNLTSLLELELDFSDHEDLEFADRTELLTLANKVNDRIGNLINSFERGQAIKNGIPIAIIGETNVGKSTLLNQLLKEDRAIVSDIHGTTRDTIEDVIEINNIQFRFIDTAGIRQTTDEIEQIGIERTYQAIRRARVVLWLINEWPKEDIIADLSKHLEDKKLIIVYNKSDILTDNQRLLHKQYEETIIQKQLLPIPFSSIEISAKIGTNIDSLRDVILKVADIPEINGNSTIVTSIRHYESLSNARQNLNRVITGLHANTSGDLIAEDLRLVLSDLAEITGGVITPQDTLNSIFEHFCIGK
ncbi:MAG: tRNA uridine-5-carboxymethylaminomethyl(34) synthesis GTPase MnmE [Prevotella sp.]|nr:tRNA uridine-5-carboxymethylaminomethyl(34) synthesis GTPase MnmE [Prevotella sp.]